jgi:hypothetical protein
MLFSKIPKASDDKTGGGHGYSQTLLVTGIKEPLTNLNS